ARRRRRVRRLESLGRRHVEIGLPARPLVEPVEQPVHLEIGEREQVLETAREERLAVADGGEPPDELDAGSAQGIQVERRSLGRADELRRRQIARTLEIVYFIV